MRSKSPEQGHTKKIKHRGKSKIKTGENTEGLKPG